MPGRSLFTSPTKTPEYWPTQTWRTLPPEDAGVNPSALVRMEAYAFTRQPANARSAGIRTDGVVIIRRGYLVYERYAGGFHAGKRHLIWSAAKSVTNALYGIAIKQGLLDLDDPAWRYFPSLDRADRRGITIHHLLQSCSGLYSNETYESSPFKSTVNAMLFGQGHRDMAAYAAAQQVIAPPGVRWEYSSLTSTLLMAILKNRMVPQRYADYPWVELFEPLGIRSAVWERDPAGTFIGSSYVYLTPRDMARFGLLYLNDGIWEGERILPHGWVAYSTQVSPAMRTTQLNKQELKDGCFGAQWWLNQAIPEWGIPAALPNAPADLFSALGHWGQAIYVIPSLEIVIALTGDQRDASFDANHFLSLILEGVADV